jgi:tripartite-type tricarboxylate transporter receptor subunit TctC
MIDVVGGHTKVAFGSVPSAMGHIRANRVRALGVGELKRIAALPEVPTIDEAGIPGYAAGNWIGLVAPAGTPPAVVAKLHKEIQAILDTPEAQKAFANEGADVVRMSSDEFGAFMRSELAKWGKVVKEAGIKAQ